MKRILLLCLAIVVFQACSSSGNSADSTQETPEVSETPVENGTDSETDSKVEEEQPAKSISYAPIDPDLLANVAKPYNIASYYKLYAKSTDEAERVLSGNEQYLKDRLDTLDLRNGYMRVMLIGDGASTVTEYVYWNLSDGRKLFGVNEVTYDFNDDVYTSSFEFRAFADDQWESFDVGDLAELMGETGALKGEKLQGTKLLDQVFPGDEIAQASSFKLSLPQRGKDITLVIKKPNFDTEVDEPMRTVVLKFNDGKFEYQGE